ncbi:tRNA (adenosine(37)-N6)-dimethylallyltransferase MiaA [bacterium]|nr:tRNA (adenosine(37)-N6)-dimethylallyltransferase MiaA [bacterium]
MESQKERIPLIILSGPTASGKTEVGIELALLLQTDIISADARAIYKYMDIGTAKPTPKQRKKVKHHLIDIAEPNQIFTVADYLQLAIPLIKKLYYEEGKIPLIVGGTRLYIDSLLKGLFSAPPANQELRQKLLEEEKKEKGSLYKKLTEIDPERASELHPNDIKRITRALEIYYLTGKKMSELRKKTSAPPFLPLKFALMWDREALYRRINERAEKMVKEGLIEEVKKLLEMGCRDDFISMQGHGYREIMWYLQGKMSLEQALYQMKRNTRHYARRQIIWLRGEDFTQIKMHEGRNPKEVAEEIYDKIPIEELKQKS